MGATVQILHLELFIYIGDIGLQLYIGTMSLSIPSHFYAIKSAPSFQTAGLGVFAGLAFEKNVLLPVSWKTLYLPNNFPNGLAVRNYVFNHNETHIGLVLDYGSLLNHHESANVQAGRDVSESNDNVLFQVRMGFQCANRNNLKICNIHACTRIQVHNRDTNT